MSQEWDEVDHEVNLMIERLDAFCDDLRAAAAGGELTEDQCAIVRGITVISDEYSLRLLELHAEATFKKAEQGDDGSRPE